VRTTVSVAIACALARGATPCLAEEAQKKKAVPLYTNEDLRRFAGSRDEPTDAPLAVATPSGTDHRPERGESYWRREADRVREKVAVLRADADALRARLAAARAAAGATAWSTRSPGASARTTAKRTARGRSRTGGPIRAASGSGSNEVRITEWESRLRSLEERIRSIQAAFEERARRAGALPGWLR